MKYLSITFQGEAEAAKKLGEAVSQNPGYLKLRKIRAAQSIARTVIIIQIFLLGKFLH